ncbi:MAG TPA: hypothetical protein VJN64_06345 [Terriglobales bacterium]|nr:hypothetical protein [Terriglobales bacterium]
MKELFVDWAEVTRKLGKIPSLSEYGRHSQFSRLPLIMRFGAWRRVPAGLLMFAEKSPVAQGWNDVLEMAKAHVEGQNSSRNKQGRNSAGTPLPGVIEGRPQYGEPMFQLPMLSVPTSESAVLILFGALAWELGFSILQSQAQFPDCHALRRMSADRWQLTSIEFELVSRNFQIHRHDPTKCDLIVCWEHNWPGCPLEVLELKTILLEKGIALWQKRERLPRAERETPATNANKSEEDVAGGENSPTTDELG